MLRINWSARIYCIGETDYERTIENHARPCRHGRQGMHPGATRDGWNRRGSFGSRSSKEILSAYPYLEQEDIDQALAYAAWRVEEREVPLPSA